MAEAFELAGGLDILVNNASSFDKGDFWNLARMI